eukprot:gnl/Spiro4/17284_TR9203_c0_g1_i1.p2 gnl/Spiro4/17284_TR9203_c0_g1~~gnl/Spiro4/17284_TR9203_c0_g1_i1.p2  ORF type:complete len:250 (-),score=40.25 gnl/Spiro4/17284_TR9203_c0_g1_i1:62-775(-)
MLGVLPRSGLGLGLGGVRYIYRKPGTPIRGTEFVKAPAWDWHLNLNANDIPKDQWKEPFESSPENPKVFLDILIRKEPVGRLVFELAEKVVPLSVANFIKFCKGEIEYKGELYGYPGTVVHHIFRDLLWLAGDVAVRTEYGDFQHGDMRTFSGFVPNENFELKHTGRGVLSFAHAHGHPQSASQFLVTSCPCPHLDGRNVVIGKVVDGEDVLGRIELSRKRHGKPVHEIRIGASGVL